VRALSSVPGGKSRQRTLHPPHLWQASSLGGKASQFLCAPLSQVIDHDQVSGEKEKEKGSHLSEGEVNALPQSHRQEPEALHPNRPPL
jgi:hypothetical protein